MIKSSILVMKYQPSSMLLACVLVPYLKKKKNSGSVANEQKRELVKETTGRWR